MRSKAARTWFVVIVSMALMGCATGAAPSGSPAPSVSGTTAPDASAPPLGDVTLTMWQHSYPPLNDFTKKQIEAFQSENPNITVNFELVPFEEYNQKILTALAAGQAPNVFESDDYTFAQFTQNSALAPIDPTLLGFADVAALTAGYEPNSLGLVTADGTVYGLPYDWEAPVVGYSLGLTGDKGVDPRSFQTWEDLMTAAQSMSVKEGPNLSTSGFAFVHNIDVYYQLQGTTLFNQAGVDVLNEDGTAAAINRPEATQVFELWRDAIWKYGATSPSFTSTFYTEEFGQGKVAMGFMLVWANSILAPAGYKNGEQFDIALLPTFDGSDKQSVSYAWNWTLNAKNTADQNQAGHMLLDYLSQQGATELAEAGLINPRTGWRDSVEADVLDDYTEIFESLANSRPIRPNVKFNEVWAPVTDLFKALETDQATDIAAGLASAEQEINAILAR
jgi:ABC-type glycerol-3-phosphate transport system substrate-binding protein